MLNFPHLERSMKNPRNWNRDIGLGTIFTCLNFIIIGVMGYWAFGRQVKISFYENLPKSKSLNMV
jgi:amino acid permease